MVSMDQLNDVITKKIDLSKIAIPEDWKGWFAYKFLEWSLFAIEDPWGFGLTVMLAVGPLLILSALCSWKLASILQKEEEDKKRKSRRANAARAAAHRHVKAD